MIVTPLLLDVISLIYGVLCLKTIKDVWQARRSLFDDNITPQDFQLAGSMAFYFFWPPAVLLHEGGHYAIARLFDAHDIRLNFYFYWGEVEYLPTLSGRQDWWISLAGNVVTLLLGIGLTLATTFGRLNGIWRVVAYQIASNQLWVVLAWYPALCLLHLFYGDFTVIYGREYWWAGSDVVALVNAVSLAAYLWATRTTKGRAWAFQHILRLKTVTRKSAPEDQEDDPAVWPPRPRQ